MTTGSCEWSKKNQCFCARARAHAHAAGVFVDARAFFLLRHLCELWNSTYWVKAKTNSTTEWVSLPIHTPSVCVCIMRKVYLKQKTYYDYIIFYYKIKFCAAPTTTTACRFNENFLYVLCLMCKIFSTNPTLIFIAFAVLFFFFVCLFVSVMVVVVAKKLSRDDVKISIFCKNTRFYVTYEDWIPQ